MPERTGTSRPGGRTARTRGAVLDAARALLADGSEVTVPAVAERSGVHATTIYRRWATIESLLLDIVVADVTEQSPVPATGDLRADLTEYIGRLLASLRGPGSLGMLRALLAASARAGSVAEVAEVMQPRIDQFQALLDAADVRSVDGLQVVELVIAPAYLWAQLGVPLDPERDTARLVDVVIAVAGAVDGGTPASRAGGLEG